MSGCRNRRSAIRRSCGAEIPHIVKDGRCDITQGHKAFSASGPTDPAERPQWSRRERERPLAAARTLFRTDPRSRAVCGGCLRQTQTDEVAFAGQVIELGVRQPIDDMPTVRTG